MSELFKFDEHYTFDSLVDEGEEKLTKRSERLKRLRVDNYLKTLRQLKKDGYRLFHESNDCTLMVAKPF